MIYRVIGVYAENQNAAISFAEFHENAGEWRHEIKTSGVYPFEHKEETVSRFINDNDLQFQVALITFYAAHGNASLNGADIAAKTGLPVITDLPAMDTALGGNGEFFSSTAAKLKMTLSEMNNEGKALCVAFMGILRWREEYNFLSSVTGASRNSIGGAVWLGQEA
jgi:hypothetical protein